MTASANVPDGKQLSPREKRARRQKRALRLSVAIALLSVLGACAPALDQLVVNGTHQFLVRPPGFGASPAVATETPTTDNSTSKSTDAETPTSSPETTPDQNPASVDERRPPRHRRHHLQARDDISNVRQTV